MRNRLLLVSCLKPEDTDLFSGLRCWWGVRECGHQRGGSGPLPAPTPPRPDRGEQGGAHRSLLARPQQVSAAELSVLLVA